MSDGSVGRCIAARRALRGLTQAQLADELGVEDSTVSRWESGDTFPRKKNFDELARVLGCRTVDFFSNPPQSNDEISQ